jgi:hypothetical protein
MRNSNNREDRVGWMSYVVFLLPAVLLLLGGCTEANRAVVVDGISSSMSVVEFSIPAQVKENIGGIGLGPSANRVAVWGQEAYVVNSGTFGAAEDASVQVIDLPSASLVRTIPLPDGNSPWDIAMVSFDKAYVTNLYGNSITILDPRVDGSSAIVGSIGLPAGSSPAGILVHGGRAYTANTGVDPVTYLYGPATVSVVDTATDTLLDADSDPGNGDDTPISISGLNPQDLGVDAAGNLWVVCTGDWWSTFGVVDVIDTLTLSETDSIATGGSPGSIAVGNRVALVGDGVGARVFVVDVSNRVVLRDEANPLLLTATAWSFVPEVVFDRSGEVAFALAFQDDLVFEILDFNGRLKVRDVHGLAAASGPAGIALDYE